MSNGSMKMSLQPNKRVRLALWWLLYRLPIGIDLEKQGHWNERFWKEHARIHLKLDVSAIEAIEESHPKQWQRMLDKRRRRLQYAQTHGGRCPHGWTPPIPGEPVRGLPWAALAKRHQFGIMGVVIEYKEAIELTNQAKRGHFD